MNEEIPHARLVSEEDGIYHLSGKPFFDVILLKSHVTHPCHLVITLVPLCSVVLFAIDIHPFSWKSILKNLNTYLITKPWFVVLPLD